MRIIAGTLRGRRLTCPSGSAVRPTSDRLKESLFNILLPHFPGCRFLDLFAGVGSIGLEAYSRGASKVILVEKERLSLHCIRLNMKKCGLEKEIRVVPLSAQEAIAQFYSEGILFDLVFLDPPYQKTELYRETLELLGGATMLSEGGLVIAEHLIRHPLQEQYGHLLRIREHRVGDGSLSFYR